MAQWVWSIPGIPFLGHYGAVCVSVSEWGEKLTIPILCPAGMKCTSDSVSILQFLGACNKHNWKREQDNIMLVCVKCLNENSRNHSFIESSLIESFANCLQVDHEKFLSLPSIEPAMSAIDTQWLHSISKHLAHQASMKLPRLARELHESYTNESSYVPLKNPHWKLHGPITKPSASITKPTVSRKVYSLQHTV